jgi:prepilin-type N-terminal cleavage/methylation domain-containing protein
MRTDRGAMTLIEVMLALALGSLLLFGARTLFTQLQTTDVILGRTARADDELANATRLLYALVRRAEVRPDSTSRFIGDSTSARFRSLCEQPGGWLEPCAVVVLLDASPDSSSLIADLSTGERLILARWPGQGTLRFLDATPAGDSWIGGWGRSITPPAAMAVAFPQDTIVLPIAGR